MSLSESEALKGSLSLWWSTIRKRPALFKVYPSPHKENIMNYCVDCLEDKTGDYCNGSPLYCIPYCPQLKAHSYEQSVHVN